MYDAKNLRISFLDLCYVCRQRRPAAGRGALVTVVSDPVDGRVRHGIPEPGGLEAGAGDCSENRHSREWVSHAERGKSPLQGKEYSWLKSTEVLNRLRPAASKSAIFLLISTSISRRH